MSEHSHDHKHHHHCCDVDHAPKITSSSYESPLSSIIKLLIGAILIFGVIYGYFALKSWFLAHTGTDISFFK